MCSSQQTVGLAACEVKQNLFLCTDSQFFTRLMTAQSVDPLPLFKDFPGLVIKTNHF
jgi:hypothetical protein